MRRIFDMSAKLVYDVFDERSCGPAVVGCVRVRRIQAKQKQSEDRSVRGFLLTSLSLARLPALTVHGVQTPTISTVA